MSERFLGVLRRGAARRGALSDARRRFAKHFKSDGWRATPTRVAVASTIHFLGVLD